MKYTRPDQLPDTAAELDELAGKAQAEINVIQAKANAHKAGVGEALTDDEIDRLGYLVDERDEVITQRDKIAADDQANVDKLAGLLDRAAPKPKAEEAKPELAAEPDKAEKAEKADEVEPDEGAAADVVAEAEAATQEAAQPQPVTAAGGVKRGTFAGAVTTTEVPKPTPTDLRKKFTLAVTAPNHAKYAGELVDTAAIAEGICNDGQFTGIRNSGPTVLATMERPGDVFESDDADEFYAKLDRIGSEIPGHGAVTAQGLVAAGGWCAPSEQRYDFCETPAAVGLLSLPEMMIKRGGVIFPAEPDFSALQTGFHFTETELEADSGSPNYTPTALKNFVEIPCPPEMVEYRLEAIGWAVKSGILQKRAWPELVKKFLDEFMVAHEYRVSALSVAKILAQSSAAKVVPTDAVLGATTSILNGLHMRARNLQIKTRKQVIEGVAPLWFRDVLLADLAARDDIEFLNVTYADVDRWLAARGIYLQYEGAWQSLTSGQPGHEDTSWWPGSVDVVLYPAGTFWRSRQNVLTLGVQFPMDLVQQNRQMEGFVEDEFQVGKRCYPSHLIRIPLCVNGAVGARESIDCSGPYAATKTATITITGTPTGGNFTAKFSANGTPTGNIAYNASAANVKTALVAIDDAFVAADFSTAGGALPGTAVTVTYPAELGDLDVDTKALTGGTSPDVTIA